MIVSRITVAGADKLAQKLRGLPPKVRGKIVRPALRAGAKIVQSAVIAEAPKKSGFMASEVKVRAGKRLKRGTIGVNVILGDGFFRGDAFYGAFVEFGHRVGKRTNRRTAGTTLDNRPQVAGRHFMKKASDRVGAAAAAVSAQLIRDGVAAVARTP